MIAFLNSTVSFNLIIAWGLVSPFLLGAGALAVAVPIIIHLLNRRRFKVVDWAAMDFLKQAEKLNKRRVQLEDLLLLLLRCLAMLLIGFMLARPFLKSGFVGSLISNARSERIFVLDDSPSMGARGPDGTALDVAVRKLGDYLSDLASDESGDAATLYLTSTPEKPLFAGVPLRSNSLTEMLEAIDDLKPSDHPADYNEVLSQVRRRMQEKSSNLNRILFVMTDLRQRDWAGARPAAIEAEESAEAGEEITVTSTMANLQTLSKDLAGCFLLDFGSSNTANLEIMSIAPQDKTLVGGVPTRFDVTVRNHGNAPATDVAISFGAASQLPMEDIIARIPPGGTASVPFTYSFAREESEDAGSSGRPAAMRAVIKPDSGDADMLDADNERLFPGRVMQGVRVVIVDGNPEARAEKTESFFLKRALAPRGSMASGMDVKVMGVEEFDDLNLDEVQYLVLCNAYRVTNRADQKNDERLEEIRAWVASGGGLFIALGDEVDEDYYNQKLYRDGKGLLPLKLVQMAGDDTGESWANYQLLTANHPALKVFEGDANPLLADVKVFRWWQCELPVFNLDDDPADEDATPSADEDATLSADGSVQILARFTNGESDPALVEAAVGEGRVLVSTTSLDLDWSNWPKEFSYLIAQQEIARYLARNDSANGLLTVGEPIRQPVDLSRFKMDLQITAPGEKLVSLQARKPSGEDQKNSPVWRVAFDEVGTRGFYELALEPARGGDAERVLFAANMEAGEGALERVDTEGFKTQLADSNVEYAKAFPSSGKEIGAARHEIWKTLLFLLVALLCGEQIFAWWLGNRRTVS